MIIAIRKVRIKRKKINFVGANLVFALYSRAETSSAPTVYAIFMQIIHTLRMKFYENSVDKNKIIC